MTTATTAYCHSGVCHQPASLGRSGCRPPRMQAAAYRAYWLLRCSTRPRNVTSGKYCSRSPLYSSGSAPGGNARSRGVTASSSRAASGENQPGTWLGAAAHQIVDVVASQQSGQHRDLSAAMEDAGAGALPQYVSGESPLLVPSKP